MSHTRITKYITPAILKRGFRIDVGQPTELVFQWPLGGALAVSGFASDSAFPSPPMLEAAYDLVRRAFADPGARLMTLGHTDDTGYDEANKDLADRRAKVLLAALTQDSKLLGEVAKQDHWADAQWSAMLAALGIGPLKPAAKPKAPTKPDLQTFQRSYNQDCFHPEGGRKRAYGDLKADGVLGPRTQDALCDAYLALVPLALEASRFIGPKFAGCGRFNPTGDKAKDRRVVLAMFGEELPTESRIPCKEGNKHACVLFKQQLPGVKRRCKFYSRLLDVEVLVLGKAPAASVKVLIQTVDELGYRLGHQSLMFTDSEGNVSHVTTDDKGVFDGALMVASEDVQLRLPDGTTRDAWVGSLPQGAAIDVVVSTRDGDSRPIEEQAALLMLHGRIEPDRRHQGRSTSGAIGEPWESSSPRGGSGIPVDN